MSDQESAKPKRPTLAVCLAKVLSRRFKEKNVTQEAFAAEAKVARGTVLRAFSLGRVTIPNLHRICLALNVKVSTVFQEAETERSATK